MRVRMYGTGEEREVDEATGSRMIARAQARRIRAGEPEVTRRAVEPKPQLPDVKRKEIHDA